MTILQKIDSITLRKKTLLIIGITLVFLIIFMYVVSSGILLGGFARVEKQDTIKNVQRATEAINNDLSSLEIFTSDWARWDDTYAFVEDINEEYITANLYYEEFIKINVNVMLYVNSSGGIAFSRTFDLSEAKEIPVSPEILELIKNYSGKLDNLTGLIMLPDGPMLIASGSIFQSSGEGPQRGNLIMGRYLDFEEIEHLSNITHLYIKIYPFYNTDMPPDFKAVRDSFSEDTTIIVRPLGEQSVAGYTFLNDVYGKPGLLLSVDMPRAIYDQGRISINYLLVSLIIVGLVFMGIFIMLLEKLILSRLALLSNDVISIGETGKLSKRVIVKGNDELSKMAGSINGMLELLELADFDRKKAEEIRLENERLLYANKTKSEFLATMSHELRTPLNGILGFSEMLIKKTIGDLNAKQERYLKNIYSSGENLLNLINDILLLTQMEAGRLELADERFEVKRAINDVVALIEDRTKKHNIEFEEYLDPKIGFIEADRSKFKQIMFNLLDNAVKFSKEEGGTITIAAKASGDLAQFSISDTGIGIKEGDIGKLFNKFQQVDSGIARDYSGTGLGLAISKQLVELHGGKIWVESKYGEGTTFSFALPIISIKEGELKHD
jgi:signal transduction histidine kinase